eukprot:scaffold13300_cov95-Skeletonema_dohrnii-CCMP3373.AAC.2
MVASATFNHHIVSSASDMAMNSFQVTHYRWLPEYRMMHSMARLHNWNITQKNWYYRFNPWGLKNKVDCCAPDTVSFHYAKQPAIVRHLHALLYHCSSSDSTYAETAH